MDTQLVGDPADRALGPRRVSQRVQRHPRSSLAQLIGVLLLSHDSDPSVSSLPPSNPGRFNYRYSADRARRTLRGIDTQVAKAEKAVAGKIPVKRNRFVHLSGATRSINRDLEKRARTLAGWKGYVTNLPNPDPETVISAYHRLYNIEKSFRMSKSDLRARPIYHHLRQSIEAHLTIVTAALAMARWLETTTGWSIRRLITTARRYRTITINIAGHTLTAADPLPPDLTQALHNIHHDTK